MNLKEKVLFGVFLIFLNLVAWQKDGVSIATGPGDQTKPHVVMNGSAFIIVYNSWNYPIYPKLRAAKVNGGSGERIWDVSVVDDSSAQEAHQIVVDKNGITWVVFERTRVFPPVIGLQKLDSNGEKFLGNAGIDISLDPKEKRTPQLCLDDSGEGCYVTWEDFRPGDLWVYLAKVTKEGKVAFQVPVCSIPSPRWNPSVIPSGIGIMVFWGGKEYDTTGVYANRMVGEKFLWGNRGKLILPYPSSMQIEINRQGLFPFPYVTADSSGGAYVFPADPYKQGVQRVDSLGNLLFASIPNVDVPSGIAPTGEGVVGYYLRRGGSTGSYHQYIKGVKVDSSGVLPWGDTLRIWTGTYSNDDPPIPSASIVSDYHKSCITAIGGQEISLIQDIIAVHTDSSGKNGEPIIVCRASNDQQNPVIIQEPSTQGYIVAWEDSRNGNSDIYAAYLDSLLQMGIQENGLKQKPPSIVLFPNTPNPFSGSTNIRYQLPSSGNMVLRIQNVLGQAVRTLSEGYRDAGDYGVKWDARNWRGERLPDGIYFYELRLTSENGEFCEIRKTVLINNK